MTEREIQLLAIGFQIGATAMLLVQIVFNVIDNRRAERAAKVALARSAKWPATDGWREALTVPERT